LIGDLGAGIFDVGSGLRPPIQKLQRASSSITVPRCALDDARDKARESCWHWPHRGTSGELLDQRSNQAQEFLLLWSVASRDEKGSDLNVRDLST